MGAWFRFAFFGTGGLAVFAVAPFALPVGVELQLGVGVHEISGSDVLDWGSSIEIKNE